MIKKILYDERGNPSAARTFLFGFLVFTAAIIVLDSAFWDVSEVIYTLLGSINVGLMAWAGGPRAMQYLGPQVSGVAAGIAKAVKGPQRPELLDSDAEFREDDEK